MTRKLVPVLVGVALAGATTAWVVRAADESADAGPVRLLRNLAPLPTNPVATMMFGAGVRNCAARADQVVSFLTKGTQSSALVFLPENEPDNSMASVSLEVRAEGLPRAYANVTLSPNTAIGCAAEYETVQYWNESCSAVAARTFRGATPTGNLGSDIGILLLGPAARVFLMRTSPSSCVTIKKEVLK
jgi:hypothetical protein